MGGERQATGLLGQLEPVDPLENVLDGLAGLGQRRALLDKRGDDAFDQRDLGVLETLEAPAVEFQAEGGGLRLEAGLDHLQHAGLSGPPIAVHTDGHRPVRMVAE